MLFNCIKQLASALGIALALATTAGAAEITSVSAETWASAVLAPKTPVFVSFVDDSPVSIELQMRIAKAAGPNIDQVKFAVLDVKTNADFAKTYVNGFKLPITYVFIAGQQDRASGCPCIGIPDGKYIYDAFAEMVLRHVKHPGQQ
jgi:hypothetical protein